jgi:transmembrane sensor
MDQEEKLNWDKLLKHLENGQTAPLNEEELNQEELEMLLLAEETNMRLKEKDPKLMFPVQLGWEELKRRYEEKIRLKTSRVKRYTLYKVLAVAAVLVLVAGPAWWIFLRHNEGGKATTNQIQLTLANGKTVELDSSQQGILKSEGAMLNGSSLIYAKETSPVEEGVELHYNTLSVPKGKYTRLQLSDGTVVWLNAGSELHFPNQFAANKREVSLEGEAYFDVRHNAARPFIVHLKAMDVNVLGTAFAINTLGNEIYTALERGSVNIQSGSQTLLLAPGDLGIFNQERNTLTKAQADLRVYTAWKDQDIYFDNNTLGEIASRLEREYNIDFVFEAEKLKQLHFTVDMGKTADVIKILNNIKLSSNEVDFLLKGNIVQVKQR